MLSSADFSERRERIARAPGAGRRSIVDHRDLLLRRVVQHAYETVPYYRELFQRCGLLPQAIATAADLVRLPILTRETLQAESPARLVAAGVDPSRLSLARSSGSSGVPVEVRHSSVERALYLQAWTRTLGALNPAYGGRLAYVGLDNQSAEQKRLAFSSTNVAIECRQPLAAILDALVGARADTLMGYPSVLAELALGARADELATIRPRLVVTLGEVLTPNVRSLLGERLGAPVSSVYACRECWCLAGECAATGQLHVVDDCVVVEVVDEDGAPVPAGAQGQVVVTPLHSFAQPLLRYAIGDVAVQGDPTPCACGSPFSTLGEVQGRRLDYLSLADGTRIHAYALSIPLRDGAPFMQRYQIVQERVDWLRVRMICKRRPHDSELLALRAKLQALLASPVTIDFELVDAIEREENGKFRVVTSRVPRPT